jgi:hypothetical protein
MTATIQPILRPDPSPSVRPPLRVIEGGRSAQALAARYRRRRLGAALGLVTIAALTVLVGRAAIHTFQPAVPGAHPTVPAVGITAPTSGPVIVVRQGDTLWSIARRVAPGGDIRAAVDRLAAVHGTGPLQVGERLPVLAAKGG